MSEMLTLYSERPRISENLYKEIFCWLLKQKKKLSAATRPSDREKKRGRRSEMEPHGEEKKEVFYYIIHDTVKQI